MPRHAVEGSRCDVGVEDRAKPCYTFPGMRLAVISDMHVLGPLEISRADETHGALAADGHPVRRGVRRGLYRVRRRLWNGHLKWRQTAFLRALDEVDAFKPEWVIANGDYGGDYGGTGLSNDATFESARLVVGMLRDRFADRARFVFGDHDLGKYSTVLRDGGIRLESLERGETKLGIPSFWHEIDEDFHLLGVNSSLFTLDMFLPEAVDHEIPEWKRRREEHVDEVTRALDRMPRDARIILFCHDPGALTALSQIPVVQRRLPQIELTVIGHLHSPTLLWLALHAPRISAWKPRYPVARIVSHGIEGARAWRLFNPVVCPSTFGTGHHISGGLLFIERADDGTLTTRRQRVHRRHYRRHRAPKGRA